MQLNLASYVRYGLGLPAATLIALAACETRPGTGPSDLPASPELTAAVVSNPTANLAARAASPSLSGAAATDVAYISLPPGALPEADLLRISNPRNGAIVEVPVVDGGFDPVAVAASAGDTLDVTVRTIDGTIEAYIKIVPERRPPIVVRTDPPPKKRDVPLNALMVVVFSEPIDRNTLSDSTLQLRSGGAAVQATVAFNEQPGTTVVLTPDVPLTPGTAYRLVIRSSVTDLDGDSLGVDYVTDFGTQATTEGAATIIIARAPDGSGDLQTDTVLSPLAAPLRVLATVDGVPKSGIPVQWTGPEWLDGSPTLSTSTSLTDSSGVASVAVTLGARAANWGIEASIPGSGLQPVRFVVTARHGTPAVVREWRGGEQLGLVDISFSSWNWWRDSYSGNAVARGGYSVLVQDAHGNDITSHNGDPSTVVAWSVASGGGFVTSTPATGGWYHAAATPAKLGPQVVRASLATGAGVEFRSTAVSAVITVGTLPDGDCHGDFGPSQITVVTGSLVGWAWCDDGSGDYVTHDVTFEDGVGSSPVQSWGTHIRRFDEPGTYRYRCTQHSADFDTGEVAEVTVTTIPPTALPGTATALAVVAGDSQIGLKHTSLTRAYVVQPTDANGGAAVGTTILWTVVAGGGTITPLSPDGRLAVATPGVDGDQLVAATIPGGPSVTFRSTAVSAFVAVTLGGDGHCQEGGFSPRSATVRAGESVAWSWCDPDDGENYPHMIAFEDGASGQVDWEARYFIRDFTTSGTYRYRCTLHSTDFEHEEAGSVTVLP